MPRASYNNLLSLSDVVSELGLQLAEAIRRSERELGRYEVKAIDVELSVVAQRRDDVVRKIEFAVLGVGGNSGAKSTVNLEQIHKVKMSLVPTRGSKSALKVTGKPPKPTK